MRFTLTVFFSLIIALCTAQSYITINPAGPRITINPAGASISLLRNRPEDGIISAHVMAYALPYVDNLDSFISRMKAKDGITVPWLFNDYYDPSKMLPFLAAARRQGVKVIVGNTAGAIDYNNSVEPPAPYVPSRYNNLKSMIAETKDSAAIFRHNGKRVYAIYNYRGEFQNIETLLAYLPAGITRDSIELWVTPTFPEYSFGENRYYTYSDGYFSGYPKVAREVGYLLDTLDKMDGVINFPVGIPNGLGELGNLRRGNLAIAAGALSVGKVGIAGINHSYSSASFQSYGFENTLAQILDLMTLAVNKWAQGLAWITANDYSERSYATELIKIPENGLMYMIPLTSTADIGFQLPYPILDNSGISRFCLPWVEKFKNRDTTPVQITTEKLFAWYALHPKNAPFLDSMPPFLRDTLSPVLYPGGGTGVELPRVDWWKHTMYHGPNAGTADSNEDQHRRIKGIKLYQDSNTYYRIRVAAHLSKPGKLRIIISGHTYTSGIQNGPAAFYDIPQELGTPVFQILNADNTIRETRTGPQAITNSCWPGGWQLLIIELTSALYNPAIQLNSFDRINQAQVA